MNTLIPAAGEMARRVREFDWSQTALGPIETWPDALELHAAMILAAALPMGLRWGTELIVIYNDAFAQVLGDRHPAALGRPLREAWPELYPAVRGLHEAMLRGERAALSFPDFPLPVPGTDGGVELRYFTIDYAPIADASAASGVGGVMTTLIDTTEHVRKEEALRTRNDSLEAEIAERTRERDRIWQVSEDLLGVSNFDGYFINVNPAWTTLLGWSEDEIKRMHVSELRHPDDAEHSMAGRRRLAEGVPTVRMENRFRHRDGSWRWIYWTMTAERGLIYVIGRHVTAEKEAAEALERARAQLFQSQKMEALGQLTGGIAHDFNNMLMVVSGNAQILQMRLADPRDRRAVDAIAAAAARGEHLTRQLLGFSRAPEMKPRVLGLAAHLDRFRDVLSSSARADIRLSIAIGDDTWPIVADPGELELALVNLVINARDAMPEGGAITISAANRRLERGDGPDRLEGDFVMLTVADPGVGIPPEILPKVFEPFFTTKAEKGTGLGLSQVYGFARQSGGAVAIASRPGEGCAVTLYLRRGESAPADQAAPGGAVPTGHEAVLLVEDNHEVAAVAAGLLTELGYRVCTADCGAAALALIEAGAAVDLVFSDIVMPGEPDGLALACRIARDWPKIAVVLTSGYVRPAEIDLGGFAILSKPYRLPALASAIRDALDAKRRLPANLTHP
jgi:PAS domain S-box-containing protein